MTGVPSAFRGYVSSAGLPLVPTRNSAGPCERPEMARGPRSISREARSATAALRRGAGGALSPAGPANWWNEALRLARYTLQLMFRTPGVSRFTSPTGVSRPFTVTYSKRRKRAAWGLTRPPSL